MTCDECGNVMLTGRSCLPGRSMLYGTEVPEDPPAEHCRDCGVKLGGHHHAGCCVAVCVTCGLQALRVPAFDTWQESCRCAVELH